jgi:hypothetical protein
MSHITTINLEIRDLEALREATHELGMELCEGQRTYAWYGKAVPGDPIPEGFSARDLGRCEHAIRVPGVKYEIGVARNPLKPNCFILLGDFKKSIEPERYDGWKIADALGGNTLPLLTQRYGVVAAERLARASGWYTQRKTLGTTIKLICQSR